LCGHENNPDEEHNYSKMEGAPDTEPEPGSRWTWRHFIAGSFISFFLGFIYLLFDFFDSSRFFWPGLLTAFLISLIIGFLTGLGGKKFIRFLVELILRS